MLKDFDKWNFKKKILDKKDRKVFCHEREIWWSCLGLNIGIEIDGKNKNFERPILILKTYYKSALAVPLTTKSNKNKKFYMRIEFNNTISFINLTQIRLISTNRLIRKISYLEKNVYEGVINRIKSLF